MGDRIPEWLRSELAHRIAAYELRYQSAPSGSLVYEWAVGVSGLRPGARIVLAELARWPDAAELTYRTISERTGVSDRTLKWPVIPELEAAGWLVRIPSAPGSRRGNGWRLTVPVIHNPHANRVIRTYGPPRESREQGEIRGDIGETGAKDEKRGLTPQAIEPAGRPPLAEVIALRDAARARSRELTERATERQADFQAFTQRHREREAERTARLAAIDAAKRAGRESLNPDIPGPDTPDSVRSGPCPPDDPRAPLPSTGHACATSADAESPSASPRTPSTSAPTAPGGLPRG